MTESCKIHQFSAEEMLMKLVESPIALSIRQPYCEWILASGKNIENRTWKTRHRGPIFVHASKGVYPEFRQEVKQNRMPLGGLVGMVNIVDCVDHSKSEWFNGPYGFVLQNPIRINFIPCKGALGLFRPTLDNDNLHIYGTHLQ